ncbi:hypothetical protein BDR26DRAFT_717718 [Obelidium mucronatum]|nr:hypothetical protein BDR26DRAFT_717718 [Obelidium mucronatum]
MPLFLFLSFLFRITFIITTLADSDRCGTAGPYLKSGGAFADSILLNTMNGIVGASSHYSATSFSWQLIVPYCISKLLFPQQGFVNPHDVECHRAVAIGSGPNAGRVWLVQGTGSLNATELLVT